MESPSLATAMENDTRNVLTTLITRVRHNQHPDAATELFRFLQPRFMAIAITVVGNWNDAEDAVQEAFVALYPNIHRIDLTRKPEAYCDVVCRNKCLTLVKRANRHRAREFNSDLIDQLAESPGQDPETDRALEVWQDVLSVAERETREIIRMRFVDDLTFGQIASRIEMSISGIHKKLQRLLEQMRERLSEQN